MSSGHATVLCRCEYRPAGGRMQRSFPKKEFCSPQNLLLWMALRRIFALCVSAFTISASHTFPLTLLIIIFFIIKHHPLFQPVINHHPLIFLTQYTFPLQSFMQFSHFCCFCVPCATLAATGSAPNDRRCHILWQRSLVDEILGRAEWPNFLIICPFLLFIYFT